MLNGDFMMVVMRIGALCLEMQPDARQPQPRAGQATAPNRRALAWIGRALVALGQGLQGETLRGAEGQV